MRRARWIAGVDEAGRGPLAGPVVAAAVILDPERPIGGLRDSKTVSSVRREQLARIIRDRAVSWAIARVSVEDIDALNILGATLLAMRRAVLSLSIAPAHVLVDGNRCPNLPYSAEGVVKGDTKVAPISAASILAKVYRDMEMRALDALYPMYGFARHKGYPTREHIEQLRMFGACPEHRRSFGPVEAVLQVHSDSVAENAPR